PWPAARLSQERNPDFAGKKLLVRQAHLFSRPGLQNRVFPVTERRGRPPGFIPAQRVVGMLLDRPPQSRGRVQPPPAVTCDSAVYRQRSPGKTAGRPKVGNLLGRLGDCGAANASRKGGAGKNASPPRPQPTANGLQLEK